MARALNPDDWPVKLTVRNASALIANIKRFDAETIEETRDHVTISAGLVVRRIRELCAKDTLYMRDHARAKLSTGGLAFQAGWFREDFVGQLDYNDRTIHSFYPVPVEEGWRDPRTGIQHAGQPSLAPAMAQIQGYIIGGIRDLVVANAERMAARAR